MAEAVRAATVHAAAGLARCADQQTVRLLRASEGLCRSALAVLLSAPPETSPQQPHASRPDDAPRRRRRPRGKRGKRGQKVTAMEEDHASPDDQATPPASAPTLGSAPAALPLGPSPASVAAAASVPAPPAGQSDLDDEWADAPGVRRSTLLLHKRGNGPGSAVAAPPARSGTLPDNPRSEAKKGMLERRLGCSSSWSERLGR